MLDVPVLVVGGGPVGLTMALALHKRNIRTMVVERNPTTTRHPKMDVTNGRSMEHFRRLGAVGSLSDGPCIGKASEPRGGQRPDYPVTRARRTLDG
jgi:2-polyprenyl-6-methoxyphenol hydroxylase-like FAD-dependent oxidoreductase